MARHERVGLIKKIEELRKSRIIIYFCGDRPLASTRIAEDAIRPMYEHLRRIRESPAEPRKLDLYLYSRGGEMETPWKIVTMLREFCDEFHVVIPYKAYSAATMLALGADKIWMTNKAELSPIDPALQLEGIPERPSPLLLREIGVEDVASYVTFLRQRAGLTDQAALAGAIGTLAQSLTPTLLGRVERTYNHIRLVARKLLALCQPPLEDTRVTSVVEALTEKTYVHGHGIGRKEAKQIGLQVESLNDEVADLVWKLYEDYEKELKLDTSADPRAYFTGTADTYSESDISVAYIESLEYLHAFIGNFRLQQIRRIPPQPTININLAVNLPANLRPEQLPKEVQQAIQQILQGIATQLRPMVEQEIIRQSPIQSIEGGIVGGSWKLIEKKSITS